MLVSLFFTMIIHENKEAARKACEEYAREVAKLNERLGVWEENEDSCCAIYIQARYREPDGSTQIYTFD